jgi:outer membrane autotransporter protein
VLDRLAESYGAPAPSGDKTVKTYEFSTPAQVFSAWTQAFDSWGHLGGNGNSATTNNNDGGFILGADATLYGRYRLGVAGGYTNANVSTPARSSSGNISATYIGL